MTFKTRHLIRINAKNIFSLVYLLNVGLPAIISLCFRLHGSLPFTPKVHMCQPADYSQSPLLLQKVLLSEGFHPTFIKSG